MNDLIKVEVHGDGVQTCNARDLHAFLEVGRDFTSWIKARIEKYQFVDGEDFTTSTDLRSPNRGNSKARV